MYEDNFGAASRAAATAHPRSACAGCAAGSPAATRRRSADACRAAFRAAATTAATARRRSTTTGAATGRVSAGCGVNQHQCHPERDDA
jgi:hypothetical protein